MGPCLRLLRVHKAWPHVVSGEFAWCLEQPVPLVEVDWLILLSHACSMGHSLLFRAICHCNDRLFETSYVIRGAFFVVFYLVCYSIYAQVDVLDWALLSRIHCQRLLYSFIYSRIPLACLKQSLFVVFDHLERWVIWSSCTLLCDYLLIVLLQEFLHRAILLRVRLESVRVHNGRNSCQLHSVLARVVLPIFLKVFDPPLGFLDSNMLRLTLSKLWRPLEILFLS